VPLLATLAERFGIGVGEARSRHVCFPANHSMHLGHDMAAVYAKADALLYLESDVPWVPSRSQPAERCLHRAGSHIDLHLPNGLERSYSLCNSSDERERYVVGVLKDRASRGGSRAVHEQLRIGMKIEISEPRNNFPLQEAADHTVLVAGGIGITPLLCMARARARPPWFSTADPRNFLPTKATRIP
jgi:hypothetical protein